MVAVQHEMANQQIVVITDDPVYRQLLQDLLDYEGYEDVLPMPRADGLAAAERERPALIVLDMHGAYFQRDWALAEQLRGGDGAASIPIIVCSTIRRKAWQEMVLGQDQGVSFLEKPFAIEELTALLHAVLGPPGDD